MRETMDDYPALRMEDDGFLLSMRRDFADIRHELFDIEDGMALSDMVSRLVEGNADVTDIGSQLPLYMPIISDEGVVAGCRAVPVWSGTHVGLVLYPGWSNDSIESFLYGNPRAYGKFGEGFMSCDPAFRLALLVHFTQENVLIPPLAAEAFLLGAYGEIPLEDEHFETTGLPSTELAVVYSSASLSRRRSAMPGGLCITHGRPRTSGWTVRVRGAKPKERILRECWQEIRERSSSAPSKSFTKDGRDYMTLNSGPSGRTRERSGSADVDYMVAWIDALSGDGGLPMRGSRISWVEISRRFELENPDYVGSWTPDTMRRTYKRRKADQ